MSNDLGLDEQRGLAASIASRADEAEKQALRRWIERLLEIKASSLSAMQKVAQAIRATASGDVLPVVNIIAREIKRHGWDDRSVAARFGLGGAAVAFGFLGGAGAGIVALGGGIGVPLWVLFGAGSTFLRVLYDEIRPKKPPGTGTDAKDRGEPSQ